MTAGKWEKTLDGGDWHLWSFGDLEFECNRDGSFEWWHPILGTGMDGEHEGTMCPSGLTEEQAKAHAIAECKKVLVEAMDALVQY